MQPVPGRRLLKWALLLGAFTHPAWGRAQQALVLSGGGARGLAHVGVVMQLEELGYDADLVVGTSMGAVVGALYAAGYEPTQIRLRILGTRWSEIFDPTPVVVGPDRAIRLPAFVYDLQIGRLRARRGLIGQWRVNRALAHLFFDANARSRGDFDRLARRYRAVAADLEDGAIVVLDQGDLARAVRASMAYPGFFAPVLWHDRVLVDGGIAASFPIGIARRLGATRIIGVDVSRPSERIQSLAPLSVIQRSLSLMLQNLQRDTVAPDLLVLPSADAAFAGPLFPRDPAALIEAGRIAARRDLRPLAPANQRKRRELPPAPQTFSRVDIEAPDSALRALAQRFFGRVAGEPYDPAVVLAALDRLFTTGLLEGVWPHVSVSRADTSQPVLHIRMDAAPVQALAFGARYDNDLGGQGWATIDRHGALGGRPAVFSMASSAGGLQQWASLSARIHSLRVRGWTWSVGAHVQEREVRIFDDEPRADLEVVRAGGWIGIESPFLLRRGLFSLLGRAEQVAPEDAATGSAIGPLFRLASVPPAGQVIGLPLLVEAERRWGSRTYTRVALSGSRGTQWKALQVAALIDARAVSARAPVDVLPALGDEHAIPGLRWGERRGRARIVAGADAALPMLNGHVRLRLRAGAVSTNVDDWNTSDGMVGAELGAIWSIPIGMIEAGYGLASDGQGRFNLAIGRRF
ncbi:MAG: patatin-like phospholipase family protein [Longimicrobiales bacterium]